MSQDASTGDGAPGERAPKGLGTIPRGLFRALRDLSRWARAEIDEAEEFIPLTLLADLPHLTVEALEVVLNLLRLPDFPERGERPATPPLPVPGAASFGYDDVSSVTVHRVDVARTDAEWFAAVAAGPPATLRGGGAAFDARALGERLLVGPTERYAVTVKDGLVTAGGAATWRDVLAAMLANRLYPRSINTSSRATVGGTLASDCMSRFSSFMGREGDAVRAFTLLTPDGRALVCRRDAPEGSLERRLFLAAISGYGMLGAIVESTFEGRPLDRPADDLVFETRFSGLITATRGDPSALAHLLAGLAEPPPPGIVSTYANLWYGESTLRGVAGRSELVPRPAARGKTCLVFAPYAGPSRFVMESLAAFASSGFGFVDNLYFRLAENDAFHDPIADFSFFMDGNDTAKQRWRAAGVPLRVLQQSFMIPARDAAGAVDPGPAVDFILSAWELARAQDLFPVMHDVLYIRQDTLPFCLSASRDLSAFGVTLAFEALEADEDDLAAWVAKVRALFEELSERCAAKGGRVHLVKDVFARDATLRAMYADGIAEMRALRALVDPRGRLENEIGRRLGVL